MSRRTRSEGEIAQCERLIDEELAKADEAKRRWQPAKEDRHRKNAAKLGQRLTILRTPPLL